MKAANGERLLTRDEVSDLLGVSVSTIIKHENLGRLHPIRGRGADSGGAIRDLVMLRLEEVIRLPRRTTAPMPSDPDELCARAFELFEEGEGIKQVVVRLRTGYERITAIHNQWIEADGANVIISEAQYKKLAELVGPFDSAAELVDRITAARSCGTASAIGAEHTAMRDALHWCFDAIDSAADVIESVGGGNGADVHDRVTMYRKAFP